MALSLATIYQPVAEFFLQQFSTDAGSQVMFRFDKFGSVVSDQDFIDPNHPELGYSPGLVMEKFSDLVNHIPLAVDNAMNIVLTIDSIDNAYFFRLLSPAVPYVPPGTDDTTGQEIISAFGLIKGDALKVWEEVKAESSTGLMMEYKPSLATPQNWYDKSKDDVWTNHSVQVTETTSVSVPDPENKLWKLKLSDTAMRRILQLPDTTANPPKEPLNIASRVLEAQASSAHLLTPNISVNNVSPAATVAPQLHAAQLEATPLSTHLLDSSLMAHVTNSEVAAHSISSVNTGSALFQAGLDPKTDFSLHATYMQQYNTLNVSQKLLATQYLQNYIPTQFVETTTISISFDYCVVKIRRPWYIDVFVNDKTWCIPSVAKGQLTVAGQTGNLTLMPIGFVALRNLSIEGNWTSEDIANAALATDFGPFKVNSTIVNNKLSYDDVQIAGWMLQQMPDLPPNDPPSQH